MKATQTKDHTVLAVLSVDEAQVLVNALKIRKISIIAEIHKLRNDHERRPLDGDLDYLFKLSTEQVHVNNMLLMLESLSLD